MTLKRYECAAVKGGEEHRSVVQAHNRIDALRKVAKLHGVKLEDVQANPELYKVGRGEALDRIPEE